MSNTPPPYSEITGISRAVMKDNKTETLANYNGNARPGELVVDQLTDNLYIGSPSGDLTLIGPNLTVAAQTDDITLTIANQNGVILNTSGYAIRVPNDLIVGGLPIGYSVTIVTVGDLSASNIIPIGEGVTRLYVAGAAGAYVENEYDNIGIPTYSIATLIKIAANTWMVNGVDLTENYC
jgi:hypothetical protein